MPIENRKVTWMGWLFNEKEKEAEAREKLDVQASKFMKDRLSTVRFKK